jgi:MFS family permease
MGILYVLNYIDRQNLAAAKLQGIMEDLDMTTQQFATAISILFVGYLPFQLPSNLIISQITRPGLCRLSQDICETPADDIDICCACMIWGTISACTATVQTYEALLGVRVLLGVSEAVFFPGAIYLLSAWYSKHELGVRIAGKS